MLVGVFLIALIFIILLAVLPFIFKSLFKIQNFMGFTKGLCTSILTIFSVFWVFLIVIIFAELADLNLGSVYNSGIIGFTFGVIFSGIILTLGIYIVTFLLIFFYTKGISNPNQPYNCVFMFIAGYLPPIFALIYLIFILLSVDDNYSKAEKTIALSGIFILGEFLFLLYMMNFAGTIMLCMLHHRKVNQSILCILLICYFFPIISIVIGLFARNQILLYILNMVMNLAPFGFGVFFYCKYANQDYPKSEPLAPSDI